MKKALTLASKERYPKPGTPQRSFVIELAPDKELQVAATANRIGSSWRKMPEIRSL